jgi:hypothetical protein
VNERQVSKVWGPYSFEMTQDDARAAAFRAGLRGALSGRLSRSHVAPLIAFALFIVLVAIAAAAGLVPRRLSEGALILAAIAFMAARIVAHRRLRLAQKNSLAAMVALQKAEHMVITFDDRGLRAAISAGSRPIAFADCEEVEQAGGIIYFWPRTGEPAFIPARAFANEQVAQEFLTWVRTKIQADR